MKVYDFTQKEVDYFLRECNFTPIEEKVFLMRCKDCTLQEVADELNVCYKTAYRINKRVINKIIRSV